MSFNCGEDPYINDFSVEIISNKNINLLKKAIQEDLNKDISPKELRLFKVYIPRNKTRDENVVCLCTKIGIKDAGGVEMTGGSLSTISEYFLEQPVNANLHILPESSTATGK